MKSKLLNVICILIVFCLAINLTPVVAMDVSQASSTSSDVPVVDELHEEQLNGLKKVYMEELEDIRLAEMEHFTVEISGMESEKVSLFDEIPGEREYISPTNEDLAQTSELVRSFECSNVTDVPQLECEALVALYGSTTGAGWTDNSNWLVTTTVDDWYGVEVDSGHIISVSLEYNNLTGTIPTQIGNLSNLQYLYLYGNNLSGSIPTQLGNLSNLQRLYLLDNLLSGEIPPELGNLTNLLSLQLFDNQLTGTIPSQLGNLTNLQSLDLGRNQLSGSIPPELGNLNNLKDLFLFSNQLSGSIPPELGNLSNLNSLYLRSNQLTGTIPPQLGNFPNLWNLGLYDNLLTGSIPTELGNLSTLLTLRLNDNQLSGSIPSQLGSIPYLLYLNLSNNQLSGNIPIELGDLINLYYLDLSQNNLSGDVPVELANLTNLCSLDNIDDPCYGIYELDLGYNHFNVPASEPPASFLAVKDPDWYLTQAVEETIPGATGGEIVSNDGNTEVIVPAGAVSGEVTFLFDPQPSPTEDSGTLSFIGNSFELTAWDSSSIPVTTFNQPLTLTIHYDEGSLGDINEDKLGLYYWNENGGLWDDVVNTCVGGEYTRDLEANWLSAPLCHLSEFALFGPSLTNNYLPLIIH